MLNHVSSKVFAVGLDLFEPKFMNHLTNGIMVVVVYGT